MAWQFDASDEDAWKEFLDREGYVVLCNLMQDEVRHAFSGSFFIFSYFPCVI